MNFVEQVTVVGLVLPSSLLDNDEKNHEEEATTPLKEQITILSPPPAHHEDRNGNITSLPQSTPPTNPPRLNKKDKTQIKASASSSTIKDNTSDFYKSLRPIVNEKTLPFFSPRIAGVSDKVLYTLHNLSLLSLSKCYAEDVFMQGGIERIISYVPAFLDDTDAACVDLEGEGSVEENARYHATYLSLLSLQNLCCANANIRYRIISTGTVKVVIEILIDLAKQLKCADTNDTEYPYPYDETYTPKILTVILALLRNLSIVRIHCLEMTPSAEVGGEGIGAEIDMLKDTTNLLKYLPPLSKRNKINITACLVELLELSYSSSSSKSNEHEKMLYKIPVESKYRCKETLIHSLEFSSESCAYVASKCCRSFLDGGEVGGIVLYKDLSFDVMKGKNNKKIVVGSGFVGLHLSIGLLLREHRADVKNNVENREIHDIYNECEVIINNDKARRENQKMKGPGVRLTSAHPKVNGKAVISD